jgi:hypothetical protein
MNYVTVWFPGYTSFGCKEQKEASFEQSLRNFLSWRPIRGNNFFATRSAGMGVATNASTPQHHLHGLGHAWSVSPTWRLCCSLCSIYSAGLYVKVFFGIRLVGVQEYSSVSSRPALGPNQPPIQWITGDLSPRVKRPGREADHSPTTSTEIKETWVYTSIPTCVFMA